MASNYPEEPNTETEEETLALRKKRARRVSFADVEVTSVHVFNRDDDFETQSNPQALPVAAADDEVVGVFRDLVDSDESRESSPNLEDDGEVVDLRKAFLRSIGSPSPGSSTVGSATSNDEDNFFGPVSASFIRPGRLSDSAASDDNPDITMDSTAFSMHFHSLARSDGGDLKTPTAVIAFEEKTPIQNNNPDNLESFMVLTKAKKPNFLPLKPSVVVSGGKDSNDMSIVGENPYKFDYARLSPTLDALLTEGSKDLHGISSTEKSLDISKALIIRHLQSDDIDNNVSANTELENGSTISTKGTIKASKLNLDVNAINHNTSPNINCELLPSDAVSHKDMSNGKHENSPEIRLYEYDNLDSAPMQRFIPSLSAGHDSSLVTPNSIRHVGIATPISKHKSFGINNDISTFREGMLSTQKSISKFGILQRSPCASILKEGNEKLRSRLLSYSSMENLTTITPDSHKDVQCKVVDVPTAYLEEELFTSDMINSGHESVVGIDRKGAKTPKVVGRLRENEKVGDLLQVGDMSLDIFYEERPATPVDPAVSPFQDTGSKKQKLMRQSMNDQNEKRLVTPSTNTSLDIFSEERPATPVDPAVSPSQNTWSRKQKLMRQSMSYQNEEKFATPSTNTSLMNTRHSSRKYEKSKKLYDRLISYPVKSLDKMFSSSAKYQDSLSQELRIWDKHTQSADVTTWQDEAPENAFGANYTSNIETSYFKNLGLRENGGEPYLSYQSKSEHVENFHKEMDVRDSHLKSADKDLKVGIVQQQWLPHSWRSIESSPQQSASEVKNIQSPFSKKAVENLKRNPTKNSASEEMTQTLSQKDLLDAPKCKFVESMIGKNHGNSLSMLTQVIENLSARKRSSTDLVPFDQDCNDVETVMQRSSKVHKTRRNSLVSIQEQSNEIDNSLQKTGDGTTLKQLPDISDKFLADVRDLLPPLINELNTQAIDRLEDTIIQLSNFRKYEILCHEIRFEKIDELINLRHKRTAELSLLAWKIAYEKAKVHLSRLKRERHLAIGQLLSSQIHDFQTLNLKYNHFSQFQLRDAQVENCSMQSCLINNEGNHEVSSNKENTTTQESERLNREIDKLSKYLSTYCKLKRESSSADIIALVREHLKQRQLCKFVSQLLQLWDFASFERKDGCFNIVLNYLDYLTQSFMIKTVPVSGVVISYKLNTTGITKILPNMNAQLAFEFVINVVSVKKCVASRYISLETQQLSSLMHTLLDVIEELQLAQTEITNLIQISFYSPSDKQLDLELCFIDFSSGEKAALTLDVSCLNRGAYPSEVIPHKMEAPSQSKYTLSDSFKANMRREVGSLSVGYLRILRLCRCVSEVMQTSS